MSDPIIASNAPTPAQLNAGDANDLASWDDRMAKLPGVRYAGVESP